MMASVPITIGGENHALLFTPRDIDDIEQDRDLSLITLMSGSQIQRVGVLAAFLYFGLKKGMDNRGNPLRELPQNEEGRDGSREMVRLYMQGRNAVAIIELGNVIYKALGAAEWFNLQQITDEAVTSVPQETDPPKNSEGAGSNPSSQ